nr:hypothetical protein CFP56_35812 [Quercus suber]
MTSSSSSSSIEGLIITIVISKGSLSKEEQQFGPWLRAPQFNPGRKAIVEVQGFKCLGVDRKSPCRIEEHALDQHVEFISGPKMAGDVITVEAKVHEEDPSKTMSMEVVSSGGTQGRDRHVLDSEIVGPQKQILNFEARLMDFDEAINSELDFSKPNVQNPVHSLAMIGNYQNVGTNAGVTEDLGVYPQNLNKVEDKLTSQISMMNPTEFKFEVGRMDNTVDRKINKVGLKGVLDGTEPIEVENDPKRKCEAITIDITEAMSREKKQRTKRGNKKIKKPSRFESMWLRDQRCEEVVQGMGGRECDKYREYARELLREKSGEVRKLEQNRIWSHGKEGYRVAKKA